MKDIVIYGAGGFGQEILRMIYRVNEINLEWNVIGFIDDGIESGTQVMNSTVVGNMDYLNNYNKKLSVAIAIGNVEILKKVTSSIKNSLINFPNIIDPTAIIDETAILGYGNIICAFSFLSCNVKTGNFNLLNTRCTLGHDSVLGSWNVLNPNVQISGSVTIGNGNFWGLNSSIVQGKKIPDNCVIGACSLMLRSAKENGTFYWGVPATKQKY